MILEHSLKFLYFSCQPLHFLQPQLDVFWGLKKRGSNLKCIFLLIRAVSLSLIDSLPCWLQLEFKGFLLYSRAHHTAHSRCLVNAYGRQEGRYHAEDSISTEQHIRIRSLWNSHLSPKTYWLSMKITKEMWSTWRRRRGRRQEETGAACYLTEDTGQWFHCTWFHWLRPSLKPCHCSGTSKPSPIAVCSRDSSF